MLPAWIKEAYEDYASCRQTYVNLERRYGIGRKTIRKYFDAHASATGVIRAELFRINLLVDATFFKRGQGLLIFRANGRNLYWKEIGSEKIDHYIEGIHSLEAAGFHFQSFVIDGRKGVREALQKHCPGIPVQQCQFHQIQTVTLKLTKNPKTSAGKALRSLSLTLTKSTRADFTNGLDEWQKTWQSFLQERSVSIEKKRKWRYTHERLRSAYFSLRRNIPWLFTYLDHPALTIPNTTNSCDGSFTHWKNKVILHRGLRKDRKKRMIDYLLERC